MMKSEISFLKNEQKENITSYLVDCINRVQDHEHILYFSYLYSKQFLLNKYENLNRENVTVIHDTSVTLEELEKYILQYKPDYVFIDFLKMTKRRDFFIQNKRLHYVKDTLKKFEDKYNVNVLVVVNWLEEK